MGWTVVPGYGIETTTGGAGGEVVTASSVGEANNYLKGDTPRIIIVKGNISGTIEIASKNKTLLGTGSTVLKGMINISGAQNIIIRNLEITGGTDAIAARGTDHLWIDHVYTHNASDGLIDLTKETDYYTVSWAHLKDHDKTMLLNGGSRVYVDRGKINGTINHNWFDGTNQRNPRAGFGKIHIFNDYNFKNGSYGIGFHTESLVYAEANYFEGVKKAIVQMYANKDEQGDLMSVGNKLDNSSRDDATGMAFDPTDLYLYDFTLDKVEDVPAVVKAGAGVNAKYGEIGLMPIPGQGAVGVTNTKLSWKTGSLGTPKAYQVYFGTTTNPPQVAVSGATSYDAGSLVSKKQYYWRVNQIPINGPVIQGKLWTFKAK